jgi:uncharacterized membrane protein YphA (DoxX/SURF4 family)
VHESLPLAAPPPQPAGRLGWRRFRPWRQGVRSSYTISGWLFLRLLGLIYLLAFVSLVSQILGLVGHDGIAPAWLFMEDARAALADVGLDRYRLIPTLAWLGAGDRLLVGWCITGAGLGLLLLLGIAPLLIAPAVWVIYLSLAVVCRGFLAYQWDALLLEAGFLAIAVAPPRFRDRFRDRTDPPRLGVWLLLWLLFRLMFASGAVKLASGDPAWRDMTALTYHFWTQPIPTPLAWYASRLPGVVLKLATAAALAVELLAPLLIAGPRKARRAAFVLLVGLQVAIALTGNYAFFNWLSAALCLFLLDDASFERFVPPPAGSRDRPAPLGRARRVLVCSLALVLGPVSLFVFAGGLGVDLPGERFVAPLAAAIEPFRSVNGYGLFAVMTTSRPEIVVEGSNDGIAWTPYEFRYQPVDSRDRPPWVAPHQPRLDWQLWFAALGSYEAEPWFRNLCIRLLQGSADVLRLIKGDPFVGRPPRYIRAVLYEYRFAGSTAHRKEGIWWIRERVGDYAPVLSLH